MNRSIHIDIARAITMYCVVAGHIIPGMTSKIIFLFHMPFFFVVSGYLHKAQDDKIFYLKKKVISLLVPYFVYLALFNSHHFLSKLLIVISDMTIENIYSFMYFLIKIIYGGELLKGNVTVFWFVTCLFLTQQLFNVIIVSNLITKNKLMVIALTLYLFSLLNQLLPNHIIFPWASNVVFCSFLFYWAGYTFGDFIFKIRDYRMTYLATFILFLSCLLIYLGINLSFNMKYSDYGLFIISPIAAISIVKLIAVTADVLARFQSLNKCFAYFGQASITIMFTHAFIHFQFVSLCQRYPLQMTIFIFGVCTILHLIFSTNSVTRAILLGSHKDMALLIKRSTGLAEARR